VSKMIADSREMGQMLLNAKCAGFVAQKFGILLDMNADRVEVSRDESGNRWLIRIQVGEEVIRRYYKEAKNVDKDTLRSAAAKTATDEGYTVDPSSIVFA